MKNHAKTQVIELLITAVIMVAGLALLKYLPMYIFGRDILFDASMHIVVVSFILYFIYFFIDQNKNWRLPYLIFSIGVLVVIGIQRIIADAHNDIGLLLGLIISAIAIIVPRWREFKGRIEF